MLAAAIKLVIPFIIVFPGIMALQLYQGEIGSADQAYAVLITKLMPTGMRGFMLAALFGAVMSSLDSMLNSASTIYTMDLHARHLRPDSSPRQLVRVGRIATAVLVVVACTVAPLLDDPELGGMFKYIQMFQGFVSPGIVTVFVFGMLVPRTPAAAAVVGLLLNIPVYGLLLWLLPGVAFLNHMAVTVLVLATAMATITVARPREQPVELPVHEGMDLTPSPVAGKVGLAIASATAGLYALFW